MVGRTAFLLVAALALGRASTEAQTPSLPIPVRVETLASAKIGEPREFWVSLPDRYNESAEKYPVIYMMDGDFNFNSGVIGGVRQAASLGEMPEVLEYRVASYPQSADAQVGLGDAYRQSGNVEKARECYKRALVIAM
jgi:tetratricopeptide (TPR) repeat protein